MRAWSMICALFLGAGCSSAASEAPADGAGAKSVPADVVYIDVRTPGEWAQGHLPGAIHLPLDRLDEIARILPDKDTEAVLYCRSGARSGAATQRLKGQGYSRVSNGGGLRALARELGVRPVR